MIPWRVIPWRMQKTRKTHKRHRNAPHDKSHNEPHDESSGNAYSRNMPPRKNRNESDANLLNKPNRGMRKEGNGNLGMGRHGLHREKTRIHESRRHGIFRLFRRESPKRRRNRGHHGLPEYRPQPRPKTLVKPPTPPITLTPLLACSPDTPQNVLWHIAEYAPHLRRWLVANPAATPAMLEYLAQVGDDEVGRALCILLESMEARKTH